MGRKYYYYSSDEYSCDEHSDNESSCEGRRKHSCKKCKKSICKNCGKTNCKKAQSPEPPPREPVCKSCKKKEGHCDNKKDGKCIFITVN